MVVSGEVFSGVDGASLVSRVILNTYEVLRPISDRFCQREKPNRSQLRHERFEQAPKNQPQFLDHEDLRHHFR
jgi:hypothetical protein